MNYLMNCKLIGALLFISYLGLGQSDSSADLFEHTELLQLTLVGDFGSLFSDRTDQATYFPFKIRHQIPKGDTVQCDLRVKTRGNFRRLPGNCNIPPLLLNFKPSIIPDQSIFQGQDKLKLVMPCRDEKYVVREYLAYQLLNEFTDHSFLARLVKVSFHDSNTDKKLEPMFGIIIEDEDRMASRVGGEIMERQFVRPKHLDEENYLTLSFFQFMIGNTDWSIQYRQNIKVLHLEASNSIIGYSIRFRSCRDCESAICQSCSRTQIELRDRTPLSRFLCRRFDCF